MRKPVKSLESLEFRPFIAGFRAESAAFWFLCFYILLEYIRPQNMYPVLNILPWGQLAILICVASIFMTGNRALGFGAMDKMFVIFSLLVILSGIFAWNPKASFDSWTTFASWILMYFCIVSILTTPKRILLFTLFFLLINFKLSQHGARTFAMRGFTFSSYGLSGSQGWFHNSGEFALQMVVMFSMSLVILLTLREYIEGKMYWWLLMLLLPGTAVLTVIGSSTRGGQLALVAVVLALLLGRRFLFKKVLLIAILFYVGLQFLPDEQIARFDLMGKDKTSQLRLMHWENAIDVFESHPLGIGYNNWISYYGANYNPKIVQEIHNTVLEAFVDLGYPGGILFLVMIITSFIMNARTKNVMSKIGGIEGKSVAAIATGVNLGLLGTFIAALFMSVLYYPMFWLAFALTSALRHISENKVRDLKESLTPIGQKKTKNLEFFANKRTYAPTSSTTRIL